MTGAYVVTLPGTHKLKTLCNLIVGDHTLRIEAFVMRQPDENREQLWAYLLQRNARMYGVGVLHRRASATCTWSAGCRCTRSRRTSWTGCSARSSPTPTSRSTRCWRSASGRAIRREWAWRVSRGESLENLKAFAHFAAPTPPA